MMLDSPSKEDIEEFQECSDKLEDLPAEEAPSPMLSLHAIKGS